MLHQTVAPNFTSQNAHISGFFHSSDPHVHTNAVIPTHIRCRIQNQLKTAKNGLTPPFSVGSAVRCEPSRGRLRPRLFHLLDFRPNEKPENPSKTTSYLLFKTRPKIAKLGLFLFCRVFSRYIVSIGTGAVCGHHTGCSLHLLRQKKEKIYLFLNSNFNFKNGFNISSFCCNRFK